MNGPQHYREAERLINGDPDDVTAAAVHATLALAAATITAGQWADPRESGPIFKGPQWFEVLS